MIKYASNALLATLISFSNEFAAICEATPETDVEEVFNALHLDRRFAISKTEHSKPADILKESEGRTNVILYRTTSQVGNWLECVRGGKETICPAEVGHRSASICHLGNIGYRLRRALRWDPAKEKFVGDAEADKLLDREPRGPWKL